MTSPHAIAIDCIGYVRVSTEDQAREERTSLADQRQAITQLAAKLGRVVGHVFDDPGASGGSADRPGFARLLAYCRAHPRPAAAPGYVLVLNDSRWGRFEDPEDAAFYRMECKHHGWLVRFAEGDESEDPFVRTVLRGIHSAQATAYRAQLRANTKRGMRGTAAQGYWQNEAPFGFRRLATGAGRPAVVLELGQRKADDQKVRLTPGPDVEVQTVQWLFSTYAAGGASLNLLTQQLRARIPDRKWSRAGLGKLLKNRTYLGEVIWSRRPHDVRERLERPVRPEAEWVVTRDAHPALVTPALFEAVQERLHTNQRATRRAVVGGYPLSGLIHCAHCGEPYTGGGGPKGPEGDEDRYRFYKDRGGTDPYHKCDGFLGTLQKRWVEPAVIRAIAKVVQQPVVQSLIAEALDRQLQAAVDDTPVRRRQLERDRDEAKVARGRLVQAVGRGVIQEAEATVELDRLRQEETRATTALEQLRFADRRVDTMATEQRRLLALAGEFEAIAARLTGNQLRECIAPWLENATVDKHKRVLRLTIRRVPGTLAFLQSDTQVGPGSQKQKIRLVETVRIRLPRTAWVKRRRRAAGAT